MKIRKRHIDSSTPSAHCRGGTAVRHVGRRERWAAVAVEEFPFEYPADFGPRRFNRFPPTVRPVVLLRGYVSFRDQSARSRRKGAAILLSVFVVVFVIIGKDPGEKLYGSVGNNRKNPTFVRDNTTSVISRRGQAFETDY